MNTSNIQSNKKALASKLLALGIFASLAVAEIYVSNLSDTDSLSLSKAISEMKGSKAIYVAAATKSAEGSIRNS